MIGGAGPELRARASTSFKVLIPGALEAGLQRRVGKRSRRSSSSRSLHASFRPRRCDASHRLQNTDPGPWRQSNEHPAGRRLRVRRFQQSRRLRHKLLSRSWQRIRDSKACYRREREGPGPVNECAVPREAKPLHVRRGSDIAHHRRLVLPLRRLEVEHGGLYHRVRLRLQHAGHTFDHARARLARRVDEDFPKQERLSIDR